MEIRDSIHGFIECNENEERIIDAEIFQRLRGIKQLALAILVYPCANHTRFEHSLGVMHLCNKIAPHVGLKDDKIEIIRLAGLLHDIGHGPFSHVSEQIIENHIKNPKKVLDKYQAQNVQELISIRLIESNREIQEILSAKEINDVSDTLKKKETRSIDKDIISGPIDVDKFDYLARDAYYTGVKYGIFDLEKVIESLISIDISREEKQLGIKEGGIYAVEQLLLAKFHMSVQVYQHRIRRIADAMLVRGIEYAINEGIKEIKNIYEFKDTEKFLSNFIKANDNYVVSIILSESSGCAEEIFKRIVERRLFKEIYQVVVDNSNFVDAFLLENARNPTKKQEEKITAELASLLGIDKRLVIFDFQSVTNPTFKSPQASIDTKTLMVLLKKSNLRKNFTDVSSVFANPSVDPQKTSIHIYAPLDINDTHDKLKDYDKKIKKSLDEIFLEE